MNLQAQRKHSNPPAARLAAAARPQGAAGAAAFAPPLQRSSIIASWAVLVHRTLRRRGLDADALFAAAGIDLALLRDPAARIHHDRVTWLWRQALALTADDTLGLSAAQAIYPGMLHTLSMAMYCSPNLRVACNHLVRFSKIIHPLAEMTFEESSRYYKFTWGPREPLVCSAGTDAIVASMMALFREIYGADCRPLRVSARKQSAESTRLGFEHFFQASVDLNAKEDALYFERDMLEQSLLTYNPVLEQECLWKTANYMAKTRQDDLVGAVCHRIASRSPLEAHGEQEIARELHLSLRTLQRKLQQAGTSYDKLLRDVRHELACYYLRDPELSIKEISYLLGFSEPTNFTRAFKAWSGQAPSACRG